ncbi:hypothetical protein [Aquabacter spiritensis]|uniref:Uncharacterized protein n=1 Tax=Aquabacter spiritensis TaxID=933073 RepID=A0A4R3LS17_9HYPH|nr:hypothetical protein [Aquabacter spiritensis]TCT03302.1 hypothetical protein EDC64_110167 [Aquabacter spiritensis]
MPELQRPIEIRVERMSQLVNMLDPFPFSDRDLDPKAEDYIVGWARELPRAAPITVIVHVPSGEAQSDLARTFPLTFRHFFANKVAQSSADLKELIRIGRVSLLVGFGVLALCVFTTQIVSGRLGPGPLGRFVEESLIILGWVANWRPIEIFLYDWWPIVRQRRLYRRLAAAEIAIRPARDAS